MILKESEDGKRQWRGEDDKNITAKIFVKVSSLSSFNQSQFFLLVLLVGIGNLFIIVLKILKNMFNTIFIE
jgi:hypothetical protein